jgi:predicted nucleic acid-binding Zn ribbon protein
MKFCKVCGEEIDTPDGINTCKECRKLSNRSKQRANRKARESVLRDLGLVKVRGALGGVYWE